MEQFVEPSLGNDSWAKSQVWDRVGISEIMCVGGGVARVAGFSSNLSELPDFKGI